MNLLVDFILVGGVFITLLILLLLFKAKQKQLPKKILILFFLLLLFVCLEGYAHIHKLKWLLLLSFTFANGIVWFIGPLLLLYIKSLFSQSDKLSQNHFIHFLPWAIYTLIITIPMLLSVPSNEYLFNYLNKIGDFEESILIMLSDIHVLIYLIVSWRLYIRYKHLMKLNFSSFTEKDFLWIKKLLIGTGIIIGIDFITEFLFCFFNIEFFGIDPSGGHIVVIATILFIFYLGYYGIEQSKILLPNFLLEEDMNEDVTEEKTVSTFSFSDTELIDLDEGLKRIMKEEKPYLDEDLTLNKLATLVDTTDKKLSTFLNQHLHTTFYDLINKERVESVKEKLQSNAFDKYTLLGIAYESGFKSKTSFNRIFKKETGLSPSEYRKQFK